MTVRHTALFALCLTLAARGLHAQDAVPRSGLLPVLTAGDGTQVFVDAASVSRSGDSTFVASTVVRYAQRPGEQRQADTEVNLDEWDCARQLNRPLAMMAYREGRLVRGDTVHAPVFAPVESAWRPIALATCEVLASHFAALPLELEMRSASEEPELRNREAMARLMAESYPRDMRLADMSGTVMMRVKVLETGRVDSSNMRVVWATRPEFAAAAARVIKEFRFTPAKVNGRPVAVWLPLPVSFTLCDDRDKLVRRPSAPAESSAALPRC